MHRLFVVDAFATRLFTGNPAAVVPLDAWPDDALLQSIAAENNLAETSYFVPRDAAAGRFALRWFTPTIEMDLCGHATLAAAHVLWQHLGASAERLTFESRSGSLGVSREGDVLWLDFPSRPGRPVDIADDVCAALGRRPVELIRDRDLLAVFEREADVTELAPDMGKVAALDAFAVIVTAPHARYDFVSRFFAPRAGVPEDPATGSAHCTLTPYWSRRLGKRELRAYQASKRGGELLCRDRGERVEIGGRCFTYLEGTIRV